MKGKFFYILILTFLIYPSGQGKVFAQQINFNPRDTVIVSTLHQVQKREFAISDSIQEAQLKLAENTIPLKKRRISAASDKPNNKKSGFIKNLAHKAHPYVTTTVTSNDNPGSASEKKSDIKYAVTPGVKLNYFSPGSTLNLDMHMDNSFFLRQSVGNDQGLSIGGVENMNLGPYTLSLSDNYFTNYVATQKMGVKVDAFNFYWKNEFAVSLGRSFNHYGLQIGYDRSDSFYKRMFNANNSVNEDFSFSQYFKLGRKSRILFEYNHGRAYFERAITSNSNSDEYVLSATAVLSPKLSASVQTSYNAADTKSNGDSRSLGFQQNLGFRVTDRTNLSLSLQQAASRPQEDSGNTFTSGFTLSGNHRLAFNPKFNFSMNYGHELVKTPKISFFTGHTYSYTFGCGLSYAFRQWMDFSLEYDRQKTASDLIGDFNNNRVILKTQARF